MSTEQDFFDTFTGVNHLWEISGDATDQSVTGEPGYQVETAEGAGSVGYDYESVWRWYHSRYASTRKKSKTGRRTGSGRS